MRAALRLAAKDLRVEARARELVASGLLTALLAVAVGVLALGETGGKAAVASGVLWLALVFAASLVLARAFTAETDRGTIEVLLLLPVDRGVVYAGKALAAAAVLLVLAAVVAPLVLVFLAAPLAGLLALAPIVALGVVALAAAGTLLSALAARTKAREVLLPVLLLPIVLPVLLAALPATAAVLDGAPLASVSGELTLLAGYDLALSAVSYLLFDFATEG